VLVWNLDYLLVMLVISHFDDLHFMSCASRCFYITLMHLCMQIESEKTSKSVIGILGINKSPSTHLGGVSLSINGYTHLL
jgi:hypothetical protein